MKKRPKPARMVRGYAAVDERNRIDHLNIQDRRRDVMNGEGERIARVITLEIPQNGMPLYWVATYGEMGLDVTFYPTKAEYDDAMTEAEKQHAKDDIDSYTGGDTF